MRREREPSPAEAVHQLHNCGAGPREVFRTPAIGVPVPFDFRRAVLAWAGWGEDRALLDDWADPAGRPTARVIATAARRVLAELGGRTPPAGRGGEADAARMQLGALAAHLVHAGALRDLVGIASHAGRPHGGVDAPTEAASTLELAITLVVYAVYAPPLLLWVRTPSLRWFRGDTLITLRRFGAATHTGDGA